MNRKQLVAECFSAAAATYDSAAQAQAQAADRMVELVAGLKLPPRPTVLEVGCGTGLLTRRLLPRLGGDWMVTDLSPAMVAAAAAAIGPDQARFRVMDGESPDAMPGLFDLIVSNLAVQWFHDLGRAVNRLRARLAPGGTLAFSTLGHGSFANWVDAHAQLGLHAGTPAYPDTEALKARLPRNAQVLTETVKVRHADGRDFAHALKRIGAGTPVPGHIPLSAGALRRVFKILGGPFDIDYVIHYALIPAE
ncbi:methyltransferase domain-containing protein [Magnetospirillum aberrantis]|uniref:Methyltransferase domain-containing protein n=1 Tax=Magnetospirillum aberrantis SpK TaxID=908842 RepID=A0A7C9QUF5_9PROT|nr:methyltransferase domain-containing protein [Magnetospirillum aberrantis]NFV79556.1 methyltransferase domain-containing protein [Magnetospirillum aberrantis SpK]